MSQKDKNNYTTREFVLIIFYVFCGFLAIILNYLFNALLSTFLTAMKKTCAVTRPSVVNGKSKMADVAEDYVMESENTDEIIPKDNSEIAELKKENGNQLFKVRQYRSALSLYTDAIKLCPESAAYYGNRAACYIMLNRFEEALDDSRRCVKLDPTFVKGYVRIIKCGIALGDLTTAEQAINVYNELEPTGSGINNELQALARLKQFEGEAIKAYEKKDYRKVVYCMDRCLDDAPTCQRYKILKAECLVFLGRFSEAQEIANSILHINKGNADAIYVRGLCLFYEDQIDSACNHFQQVLRLAPDHPKAIISYKSAKLLKKKKEEGNDAYKNNRIQEAINLYSEALLIDPLNKKTNAKLYFNKAIALARLTKPKEAIENCTAALNLDETYLKALLRRAKCYMDLEEYEDAVKDYEKALKMEKSRENKKLLQDAKMALKKSKRKDYYKILGIDRNANEDEIKRAYKKRALIHHPDRHANASDIEKKEQEKMFKELGEAYGVLSDPKKKMRYDSGQDMEMDGMQDIDPTQMFQFFQRGPSEFSFGNEGGFPGGFSFQFS